MRENSDFNFGFDTLPPAPPEAPPALTGSAVSILQDLLPVDPMLPPAPQGFFDDLTVTPPVAHKEAFSLWPPRFPFDLAAGLQDEEEILQRHGIDRVDYERLKALPAFRKALAEAVGVLKEKGFGFKVKCRAIAEEYLEEIYTQLFDRDAGVGTRLELFKYLTKLGELEPEKQAAAPQQQGQMVNIQINLNPN